MKKRPRSPPPPARESDGEIDSSERHSDIEMDVDDTQAREVVKNTRDSHDGKLSTASDAENGMEVDRASKKHRRKTKKKPPSPKEPVESPMENGPSAKSEAEKMDVDEKKSDKDEKSNGVAAVTAITEENEQLDFEADGQWKDVKEDGEVEKETKKDEKEINEVVAKSKEVAEVKEKDKESKKNKKDKKKEKKDKEKEKVKVMYLFLEKTLI